MPTSVTEKKIQLNLLWYCIELNSLGITDVCILSITSDHPYIFNVDFLWTIAVAALAGLLLSLNAYLYRIVVRS